MQKKSVEPDLNEVLQTKERFRKGKLRTLATRRLSRTNKRAKKLWRPGSLAQLKWGSSNLGLPWRQLVSIRGLAHAALGRPTAGRCAFTTTRLEYPEDPIATIVKENLSEWHKLQSRLPDRLRRRVHLQWTSWHQRLHPAETRWKRVRGPTSSVVATLLDLQWVPISPTRWISDSGNALDASEPSFDLTALHAEDTSLGWISLYRQTNIVCHILIVYG